MNVVLLPGLDGTGKLFGPVLEKLGTGLRPRVMTYPADQPTGLEALASRVLRELPDGGPVLVAESFSGLVALQVLTSAPSRVRAVVFVGAFGEPPRPMLLRLAPLVARSPGLLRTTPAFLLRQFCLGSEASTRDLALLRETLAGVSPAVLAQRLALVGERHAFAKKFDVPCCYIRAAQDRLVPAAAVGWFRARFRQCESIEIPGPHFLLQAHPAEAAQAIRRALATFGS
jgi:pimeloyl-ACP methyl ester carboxylesterase